VPDEVGAVSQLPGDERRVDLEVDPARDRRRGEARAVDDDERPALRKGELLAPRCAPADDAAVDEDDGRAVAEALDLELRQRAPQVEGDRQGRARRSRSVGTPRSPG
jgi:hypothetical protein